MDGITNRLEVTGDLSSGWLSGTEHLEEQLEPCPVDHLDGTETVTVTWKTPLPAQGARGFFRVVVRQE